MSTIVVGKGSRKNQQNNKKKTQTLGPVANLEDYVRPDWWRYIFNSLYLKTDGDVVDDHNITSQETRLFCDILCLLHEQKILDLCCGQGRHSLELARRDFSQVEGLDRSRYLIQKARSCAKKENLKIKFREGDARKPPYPPDTFDVVMTLPRALTLSRPKRMIAGSVQDNLWPTI